MENLFQSLMNDTLSKEQKAELNNFIKTWEPEFKRRTLFHEAAASIGNDIKAELWPIFNKRDPETCYLKKHWNEIKAKVEDLMSQNSIPHAIYRTFIEHSKLWDIKIDSTNVHFSLFTNSKFLGVHTKLLLKGVSFLQMVISEYTTKNISFEFVPKDDTSKIYDLSYFYVSEENKNTYESILNLVRQDRKQITDPIYIQGPLGSGKTRLLRCLYNHCAKEDTPLLAACTSFEALHSDLFMDARLQNNNCLDTCKNLVLTLDFLLIDNFGEYIELPQNSIMYEKMISLFNCCIENGVTLILAGPPLDDNLHLGDVLKEWLCNNAIFLDLKPVEDTLFEELINVFDVIESIEKFNKVIKASK